jgi:hypothetical protein
MRAVNGDQRAFFRQNGNSCYLIVGEIEKHEFGQRRDGRNISRRPTIIFLISKVHIRDLKPSTTRHLIF